MTGHGALNPLPCGTEAAYQRHLRHGEHVDYACRAAATGSRRQRYQARRARGQAEQSALMLELVRVLADALGTYPP